MAGPGSHDPPPWPGVGLRRTHPAATTVEFLVEFEINPPEGIPESEVVDREEAETAAAGTLVEEGHLIRVWMLTAPDGESRSSVSTVPTTEPSSIA